jgi:hypothetical protein
VYAHRNMIILDDVLSALDATTEHHIVENLIGPNGLFKELGTAVLLITHASECRYSRWCWLRIRRYLGTDKIDSSTPRAGGPHHHSWRRRADCRARIVGSSPIRSGIYQQSVAQGERRQRTPAAGAARGSGRSEKPSRGREEAQRSSARRHTKDWRHYTLQ